MSASDAAPLPRLGEVFFDVRGDSRSMRLSWYADTGIAVFSIWQGGRCTGTFRLPMDDLARMTEILQRGPQRRHPGRRPDYHGGYDQARHDEAGYESAGTDEAGYDEDWYDETWYDEEPGSRTRGAGPDDHELAAGYADRPGANRPPAGRDSAGYDRSAGYGEDWYGDEQGGRTRGHGGGDHELAGGYADRPGANRPSAGRDSAGYDRSAGYGDSAGYEHQAGYADLPADAGPSDATGRYEFPARAGRPEEGSYRPAAAGHDGGQVTDLSGYGEQRFVPPYVRSDAESYPNDNLPPGPVRRHGAGGPAYPADRAGVSPEPGRYPPEPDSAAGYSGSTEYLPAADPGATAQYSGGRHSGRQSRSSAAAPFAEPELDEAGEPISEQDFWRWQTR